MYKSLNSKFANFEKTSAGKDSILKFLLGKSPSKATSEAADSIISGARANEAFNDQIARNLAGRIEEGRRRGALKGMLGGASLGLSTGSALGGVLPRYDDAVQAMTQFSSKNPGASADDLIAAALQDANPLAMLAGGGVGALGLGYAGKKVGAGIGRFRGLKKGLTDIPDIGSRRIENEILRRM